MAVPEFKKDPLYNLLREGHIEEFNRQREQPQTADLKGADLRGLDLREANLKGLDLSDCYLRQADLRGVDLRETRLEGASIMGAKISGAYFPKQLSAAEIDLSLQHGTRLRYQ